MTQKVKEQPATAQKVSDRQLLKLMMEATRGSVFLNFEKLPGAIGSRDEGFVFVPGKLPPQRRPLLVAHADTVWERGKGDKILVKWDGNLATSDRWKVGIGADDRAGCAMLWKLQESGASLLLTDEEESGCKGAAKAVAAISKELKEHIFGVQMDRHGDSQAVFYQAASKEFQDWLLAVLGGMWRKEQGSWSDVAVIGPAVGLNCVNVAAGFWHEHTAYEMLFLDAWRRGVAAIETLVQVAAEGDLEQMKWPEPQTWKHAGKKGGSRYLGDEWFGAGSGRTYWNRSEMHNPKPWENFGVEEETYWGWFQETYGAQDVEWLKKQLAGAGVVKGGTYDDRLFFRSKPTHSKSKPKLAVVKGGNGNGKAPHEKNIYRSDCKCQLCEDVRKKLDEEAPEKPEGKAGAADEGGEGADDTAHWNGKEWVYKGAVLRMPAADALLVYRWEDLTRAERQAACAEAKALAYDLVLCGAVEPGDDARKVYFEEVIGAAALVGKKMDTTLQVAWETRLVFNNDDTDPRVIAMRQGLEWCEGVYGPTGRVMEA